MGIPIIIYFMHIVVLIKFKLHAQSIARWSRKFVVNIPHGVKHCCQTSIVNRKPLLNAANSKCSFAIKNRVISSTWKLCWISWKNWKNGKQSIRLVSSFCTCRFQKLSPVRVRYHLNFVVVLMNQPLK